MKKRLLFFFYVILTLNAICFFSGCTTSESQQISLADDLEQEEIDVNDDYEDIEEEIEPPQLSDECDYILCDGYDNNDYYELVATLEEDFPESVYKIGVIKNNEWLVKLSKKSPFIDKDGRWKGVESYENNSVSEDDFKYIGEGCFYYETNNGQIIYKPQTGVSFHTANIPNLYGQDGNVDYENIVNNSKVVTQDWDDLKLTLFNLNTGKAKKIKGYFENHDKPDTLYSLSEGVFYAKYYDKVFGTRSYKGFFNTNGKMVINLTGYEISELYDGVFENGKFIFTTKNDTGTLYDITIDKKGKIINKEKM